MDTDKHGFADAKLRNAREVFWSGFNSCQFVKFVSFFLSAFVRVHPWLNLCFQLRHGGVQLLGQFLAVVVVR